MTDYSGIVGMFPPEPEVAAARVAQAASPDKTAAAIPVAQQLNIPPILVESDPQFWGEQARLRGARQAIGTAPLLAPWLAGDPANARLAGDDLPQLAKVAPTIPESAPADTFWSSIARGWSATEHNREVADAALGIGEMPPPLPPAPPREPGVMPYLRETFGSFIGSLASSVAYGAAPGAAVGGAAGAVTGPGALITAGVGAFYGLAADMALTAGGAAYEQTGTYRDGDGNPLPESSRKFAAVAAGIGTAALTTALPGIGKPALEAGKALITETVARAVPQVAAEIGKAGLKGGLLNMAYTAVQSIPEELARLGTPGFDNLVNDPQARADFVERHVQAFVDGVVLFGASGVPAALMHPLGAAIAARSDAARLDTLVETAQDSKLRQRSATVFGDFIRAGNKDDIGIAPTADPAALAKIASPEAIATAQATGADVHVPLSEYAAKVDSATHKTLRDDIRMSPDGMTLREAAEAEVAPTSAAAREGAPPKLTIAIRAPDGTVIEGKPGQIHPDLAEEYDRAHPGTKVELEAGWTRNGEFLTRKEALATLTPTARSAVEEAGGRLGVTKRTGELDAQDYNKALTQTPEALAERPPVPGETLTEARPEEGLTGFHRTNRQFIDFDQQYAGQKNAVFFTSSAEEAASFGKNVMERRLDVSNPKRIDWGGGFYNESRMNDAIQEAKDAGNDALIISNIRNAAGREPSTTYVVWDVGRIRKPGEPAEAPPPAPMVLARPGETPVEVARRVLYLEPLIKEPLPGMTQPMFERYSRLLEAQAARAAEVPEPLPSSREAAETKVDRRRDVAAFNTIAATEDLKLDPAAVGDELTHGIVSTQFGTKLDPALLREGGMHPEDIAGSLGYRSGAELVRDLMKVDREALIQKEINQTAAGSLLNRVLNSKQLDVLIAELEALGMPLTGEALRAAVADRFDGLTIKEALKPALPLVVRTGRAAEEALLKGDVAGALEAKRRQAIAFETARLQKILQPEIDRFDRLAGRYASQKIVANRDPEYTNHIQAILGSLGRALARDGAELLRSLDASPGGRSLEDFTREKTAAGRIIVDAGGLPRGKPFEQWNIAEFRQLADVLTSLDHNSREENLVGKVGAKVALDNVAAQIRDHLKDRIERVDPFNKGSIVKWAGRNFDARWIKMERLFDWIDQKEPDGLLNTYVFRPIKEAQFAEDAMRREATAALKMIDDRQVRRRLTERVDNPLTDVDGRPMRLTRGNVIAMALNMGNRSNFDKLVRGFKWDPDTVSDLVRRTLTEREWKFVQDIWDVFERFRGRADEVVRRMSGVGMDLVEAVPVQTPFGTLRGGYYPIEYDPLRSNIEEIKAGNLFQQNGWFTPLPARGYTKTRTGVAKPLRLDLDFIGNRLSETIHDIAYREALTGASKVLLNRTVRDAITRSYGPEYAAQLRPWLQDIANRALTDDRGQGWINGLLREARLNANVLMIGLKVPTALIHGTSALANSMREAGPINFASAVADFFRNPDGMRKQWQWANEMSGELRNRGHNFDRDVQALVNEWNVTRSPIGFASVRQRYGLFAMSLIGTLDKLSAVPTWIAAHKKGLSEGMADADAVYYADKVVRNAHGAGGAPDIPAIMRSSEVMRWFTMFMSYFNHNYNQSRDIGRETAAAYQDVKIGDLRAGTPHFVSAMGGVLAYLIIPAMVHELLKRGGPSTQGEGPVEWWTKALGEQVLSQIPIVRDIANAAVHKKPIELAGPLDQLFNTMAAPVVDLAHKTGVTQGPVSPDWLKHALEAPTAVVGVGAPDQIAGMIQFLWDTTRYGHFRQYANDPVAWYHGIVYGKSHPPPPH